MSRKFSITVTNNVTNDRRMLRIARTMVGAGHKVEIIGRKKLKHELRSEVVDNIQVIRLNSLFTSGALFYAEFNIRLFFYLIFHKIDILYSVDLDTISACGLMAKIKNKKWIFDSHEYFTEVPELVGRNSVRGIWTRIGKMFINSAHLRLTVGPALALELEKKYATHFNVLRNVPSLSTISSSSSRATNKTKIVYVGVLNHGRGLPEIIRAMEKFPEAQLTLLGDGDIKDELIELIARLKLNARVVLKGMIAPNEIISELMNHDIGINLLDDISESYRLSLANKFFDYIQAELPSIQMNFPEYSVLNEQYKVAHLIDDLSHDSIVDGMSQISQDKSYYDRLKSSCKLAKRELCWEEEEKRLLGLIEPILGQK